MQCTGTESNLNQCRSTGPSTSCNHRNDAGVICIPSAYAIPVRLSNGTASSNGRVEINVNGRWGVICDFGWDIRDATVVCRQLGYIGQLWVWHGRSFKSLALQQDLYHVHVYWLLISSHMHFVKPGCPVP